MDLRDSLATVRRSWLLLVVPVVVGLIVATVVLAMQTPKFLSTAKVYVSVGNATNANDLSQANSFAQSAAANYAALAEQPYVLNGVRAQLKLRLSADRIADEMTTSVEESTSIIAIDVLDASRSRAATIANATAAQLSAAVGTLNPPAADGTQNVKVTVVRPASFATKATVPNRPLGLALGLLAGLLLGVVLVILRELLDTRIRSTEDLQQLAGAPVVGEIPRAPSISGHPLVLAEERASAATEGFRRLQLNTEYLRAPRSVTTVGITSSVPAEGKSTVAANLALALAAAGYRVVLVDADLHRPRLHTMFGIEGDLGLTEVLIGRVNVTEAVQQWGTGETRLAVLPAGALPPNPSELLQSPRLREALDRLAEQADVVVVDGPPLLAVADSAVLARTVDAVLMVASMQRSHRGPVARAVGVLESVGASVLGTVATMTRPSRADSDAYLRYATDGVGSRSVATRKRKRRVDEAVPAVLPADPATAPTVPDERLPVSEALSAGEDADVTLDERTEPTERAARDLPVSEESDASDDAPGAEEPTLPVRSPVSSARSGLRSVRVPAAHELDDRSLRALRSRLSDHDLRVLRGFAKRGATGQDR